MASYPVPADSFVLCDVCIFTGDSFIERGYVVVDSGKITHVDSGDYPELSATVSVISKPGYTLLPGLIDAHVHGLGGNVLCIEQALRFGVTTVCDMHNEPQHISRLRELASDPVNKCRYADFKSAGTGATISGGWPEPVVLLHSKSPQTKAMIDSWPKLEHPSEAETFVQEQITKSEASYIKLFHELGDTINMSLPRPPLDIQRAVVKAAHAHGLIAVGHAFSYKGAIDLLTCGVDGLTHIFLDKPTSTDYITLSQQNKAYCNPTLSICGSQTQEGHDMQTRFAADPLAQKMLFDTQPRQPLAMGAANASIEHAYESVRALYQAKVPIIIGSDSSGQLKGTAYGLGVHMEIYLLTHKIQMSAVDVLKGATSLTADRLGFHDRGRVGVGKKADLVLVEGDVREILADEESLCLPVRGVWRDGIVASVWGDVGLV